MRRIFQNRLLTIIIILSIVFVSFIGFTASNRDRLSIFEGVVGNVLNPIQKYLYLGGQRVSNFLGFVSNISTTKKENELLKIENIELENKLIDYDSVKSENERLKEMLDFKAEYDQDEKKYDYLGANIIGKGSGNWFDVFIIDKGSNQNVKKYYPVISGTGLVGQVMDVGPNWSKVLSIIDEKSRVNAVVSRIGDLGIIQGVSGFSDDRNCKMMYLPANSSVQKGDMVVTSALSKFFPQNIKIGTVVEINDDTAEFGKSVTIKPAVDFRKLEEVFIITNAINKDDYPDEGDLN